MTTHTFFWHDYETFGRDPRLDRPAQFAGIRTDLDLNEVGDPVMIYCQPAPDYLPDPEACLLTGIVPQTCLAEGLPEYRFADTILAELGRDGTIGVGYNSIRFDDEVTRHLFWRTLRPPYDREFRNGCSRWDLLDVVRCTAALRPDGIEWPRNDQGCPSFKLEHLSAANGLGHEQAHDALSDVRATIALGRLIRERQPKLWNFCLELRSKHAVLKEIGEGRPFIHISAMYGVERGAMAVVWPLAWHPTNKNELIVWDLAHDPAELLALDAESLRQRIFTRSSELPEGVNRLPVYSLAINRAPVVIGNLKVLTPQVIDRWQIDLGAIERHTEAARGISPQLSGLWPDVYQHPRRRGAGAGEHAPDVDGDLYGGFIGNDDRRRLDDWRARVDAAGMLLTGAAAGATAATSPAGKTEPADASDAASATLQGNTTHRNAAVHTDHGARTGVHDGHRHDTDDARHDAGSTGADHSTANQTPGDGSPATHLSTIEIDHISVPSFEDPRLEELSFRYRARQFPAMLNAEEKQRWQKHCHSRLHEGADNALTLAAYADRLDDLNQALSPDNPTAQRLLEALYDYGEQLA